MKAILHPYISKEEGHKIDEKSQLNTLPLLINISNP
jgi:hypothetical protein